MWYFELQLDYLETNYTPELPRFFPAFWKCYNSSISGYGYLNRVGEQISSHIEIEFCF